MMTPEVNCNSSGHKQTGSDWIRSRLQCRSSNLRRFCITDVSDQDMPLQKHPESLQIDAIRNISARKNDQTEYVGHAQIDTCMMVGII